MVQRLVAGFSPPLAQRGLQRGQGLAAAGAAVLVDVDGGQQGAQMHHRVLLQGRQQLLGLADPVHKQTGHAPVEPVVVNLNVSPTFPQSVGCFLSVCDLREESTAVPGASLPLTVSAMAWYSFSLQRKCARARQISSSITAATFDPALMK